MSQTSEELLSFIWACPSPWHAVAEIGERLGLQERQESVSWDDFDGKSFWIKRGGSVAAFKFPSGNINPDQMKYRLVAAHTDSPCLRLKPRGPEKVVGECRQWGVEIYGGALLNSWLDRDLGVAGRVTWWEGEREISRLVRFDDWRWRVPQLAIHLDREANKGLALNPQKHMVPVIGLDEGEEWLSELLHELNLNERPKSLQFDLVLYDTQKPCHGGQHGEFIYAPRMDNLAMCHAGLEAFMSADPAENIIDVLCCFHHEEIGSVSTEGAGSSFLPDLLERVSLGLGLGRDAHLASLRRSYMVSADMAHALHPNYPDRHEPDHQPVLGAGPVLKGNVNLRYAGSGSSHSKFLRWAEEAEVPVQDFVCRTDMGCGSTIGPTLAARLGMEAIDVGNPMLSMHSSREMAATVDHEAMIHLMCKAYSAE